MCTCRKPMLLRRKIGGRDCPQKLPARWDPSAESGQILTNPKMFKNAGLDASGRLSGRHVCPSILSWSEDRIDQGKGGTSWAVMGIFRIVMLWSGGVLHSETCPPHPNQKKKIKKLVGGSSLQLCRSGPKSRDMVHWEIKGRFRKRVVLANVPSFRLEIGCGSVSFFRLWCLNWKQS